MAAVYPSSQKPKVQSCADLDPSGAAQVISATHRKDWVVYLMVSNILLLSGLTANAVEACKRCEVIPSKVPTLETICKVHPDLFCQNVDQERKKPTGHFGDFYTSVSRSFEKFKTRSNQTDKKISDLGDESPKVLRSFEGEVELALLHYQDEIERLEKESIEPLLKEVKSLHAKAIDQAVADRTLADSMKNDVQKVEYLGFGKNKNELLKWKKSAIDPEPPSTQSLRRPLGVRRKKSRLPRNLKSSRLLSSI